MQKISLWVLMDDCPHGQSNLFILHLLQKRLSPGILEKSRAI